MTLPLVIVQLGALLIYAAITGKSVRRLLVGDSQTPAKPGSIDQGSSA